MFVDIAWFSRKKTRDECSKIRFSVHQTSKLTFSFPVNCNISKGLIMEPSISLFMRGMFKKNVPSMYNMHRKTQCSFNITFSFLFLS